MHTGQTQTNWLPNFRCHAAIKAVSLGTMLASFDSGSMNIALATLARDLHVEPTSSLVVIESRPGFS
jgi:hypothetical protein